jgi:hypothetical protein
MAGGSTIKRRAARRRGEMAPKHDVAQLEKKIKTLQKDIESFGKSPDLGELLRIIHHPGWTTIAEAMLVNGVLDRIQGNVRAAMELQQVALAAGREIVKED